MASGDRQHLSAEDGGETVIPGVLVAAAEGGGLLLTGPSGAGKSDAAWGLLERGYALVADDAVRLRRDGGRLVGSCPREGRGLLALRDLGIIDVALLRGEAAVALQAELALVVDLQPGSSPVCAESALRGRHDRCRIMGVELPRVQLTDTRHRPTAALIAAAVNMTLHPRVARPAMEDEGDEPLWPT